ncbi:serine/threonine protein kinase [Burkholderia cepacia]|uniref:serine/threonine protein kinase n=1 Tax=Burkholderia cepacia TaxID=292 RepID=UPI0009BE6BF3|nr:serine/threonine-protein kinase [Burkholderia cepacia]
MTKWTLDSDRKKSWTDFHKLGKGGQGVAYKAKRRSDDFAACIKVLGRQDDTERRSRFSREAMAYDTCQHAGVPKFVESNAHRHSDLKIELYIATEFIAGPTLEDYIKNQCGVMTLPDAIMCTIRLLEILQYLHDEQWVHRDIKPDNIILRNNQLSDPVLLDFGLCYKPGVTQDLETDLGQEIGNRFLRLPEFTIGSEDKQNLRSDLALAGGILYFTLTGIYPATLSDASQRLPHQKEAVVAKLGLVAGHATTRLLAFFDKALHPNPRKRYASAADMIKALNEINSVNATDYRTAEDEDLAFIMAHVERASIQQQAENSRKCYDAIAQVGSVHANMKDKFLPAYISFQADCGPIEDGMRCTYGFLHFERQFERFAPVFVAKVLGGELVLSVGSEVLHRTDVDDPSYGDEFVTIIRSFLTRGLRSIIVPLGDAAPKTVP